MCIYGVGPRNGEKNQRDAGKDEEYEQEIILYFLLVLQHFKT